MAADLTAQWVADDLNADIADGGSVAEWTDRVNGLTAAALGVPRLAHDLFDGHSAVRFHRADGADSLIVEAAANPLAGAESFTIAVAFATASDLLNGGETAWFLNTGLVDATDFFGTTADWGLGISGSGKLAGGLGGPAQTVYSSTDQLNDGDLHIAIYTVEDGTQSLFVDGALVGQETGGSTAPRIPVDLTIGAVTRNTASYTGDIAEVRLYQGALTTEQVQAVTRELEHVYFRIPPTAVADQYAVDEDQLLQIPAATGVLSNDLNFELEPLTARVTAGPEHGTLQFSADGSFEYRPQTHYFGGDSFTYIATNTVDSAPVEVTLTVAPVYDPATAVEDDYAVTRGRPLLVSAAAGLLANDLNPDLNGATVHVVEDVGAGMLQVLPDGSFRYDPGGFVGETQFRYELVDVGGTQNRAEVRLMVRPDVPPITINELHVNPDLKYEQVEFVELYNPTDATVVVEGWQLTDAVDFVFPPGARISAHGYLVAAEDPVEFSAKFGVQAVGPWSGKLNNDGERLVLRREDGLPIDELTYGLGFPWPTVGDSPGHSLQLIHAGLDNGLGGSWRSATPTPVARNGTFAETAPPQMRDLVQTPLAPASGEDVTIMITATDPEGVASVVLEYQLVDPGNYIRLSDPEYQTEWTAIAMRDDGLDGDAAAGDQVYTAVLDGNLQTHRRLVRYRIRATDTGSAAITVPYSDDPQPNFAYFVYDNLPTWTGADQPGVTDPVAYGPDVMESLPTYHLISRNEDVLEAQYKYIFYQSAEASEYKWTGTFVYNGVVYDHIGYRNRGWWSAYEWGKNKWKFKFHTGHEFQAHDNYGRPYGAKWDTLNFSAAIMPGDINPHRGEHGMFEAATYKLFNLAGVPAPRTHWTHFRVIDGSDETSATDQYEGDFWGLYLVLQQPDGSLLEEHGLPDGNLYKMAGEFSNPNNPGPTQEPVQSGIAAGSELEEFIGGYRNGRTPQEWWEQNVKLDTYYSYRAIVDGVHHYDIPDAWNSVFYHHPETDQWWMLPWDVDLTWDGNIYANDTEGFSQVWKRYPEHRLAFESRVREIRDLLFNDDQGWEVLNELAAIIAHPGSEATFAAADRARWDWAPRLNTNDTTVYTEGLPTTPADRRGQFYQHPQGDFSDMVGYMREFMATGWGANNLAGISDDDAIPDTPQIVYRGADGFPVNGLSFQATSWDDPQGRETVTAIAWRAGEVSDPTAPAYDATQAQPYEIEPVWESEVTAGLGALAVVPNHVLEVGHTYRIRARLQDDTGRWSHWSEPVELTVTAATQSSLAEGLRISEVHYHPQDPTTEERLAGFDDADLFEFIEIVNVSSDTLDLRGASLQRQQVGGRLQGVAFEFATGAIQTLGPGERLVIAENAAALRARYGEHVPLAGEWQGRLSNNRELLTLVADGITVHSFEYDDDWYPSTDGAGDSLEVTDAAGQELSAWQTSAGWRPSQVIGGTPGSGPHVVELRGDVNGDRRVTADDIDQLYAALNAGNSDPRFDINGDGQLSQADVDSLIEEILQTVYGDADLSGTVTAAADGQHLLLHLSSGGSRGWRDGDFDGDGHVTASGDGAQLLAALAADAARQQESGAISPVREDAVVSQADMLHPDAWEWVLRHPSEQHRSRSTWDHSAFE